MVNLALLLYKCGKNYKHFKYGDRKYERYQKTKNPTEFGDELMFSDDIEELYFDSANWARLALLANPNLPEANYLLGVLYEQGLSVDTNHELAF